jgi:uncharacterized membrane protein YqgA involved in biofilm formation
MMGTYVNTAAIIVGSLVGLVLRDRFPEKIKDTVLHGVGLVTVFMGVQMALKTGNLLVMIFSILVGSIIGESLDLDDVLKKAANYVKTKTRSEESRYVEGLITAFLIFSIGSMAITGAIEDGINQNPSILYAKSILDFFMSISLASVYGLGVIFSSIPLLIYQGGITLAATYSANLFSEIVINEISGVGGILLLGLGVTLLEIKEIKIANLLPSLIIVPILLYFL